LPLSYNNRSLAGPTVQAAASHVDLSPREFKDGSSVRSRALPGKAKDAWPRKTLDLSTLPAIRFPLFKEFHGQLVGGGKWEMQAVGAGRRKLVMLCGGVLSNCKPFGP
jgi:hypothetical protein